MIAPLKQCKVYFNPIQEGEGDPSPENVRAIKGWTGLTAYRIGQKNSVQVYKLITNNTIEEKINKLQQKKAKLSEDLLSTEQTFFNKLSKEEIMELFE